MYGDQHIQENCDFSFQITSDNVLCAVDNTFSNLPGVGGNGAGVVSEKTPIIRYEQKAQRAI